MKLNKRGISLIVLVITIVVIIIIAAAVILSMGKNNPIESAREASFKQRVDSYKTELTNYMTKKFADSLGVVAKEDIDATNTEDMKKIIPSLAKDDENKFIIEDGRLIYVAKDEKEIEWCTQLMVDTTALVAKISANVTSPTDEPNIIYTFKFNADVEGFEESDIEVTNGTKGTFTKISNSEYTLVVTNTKSCTQTVTIPKNVCKDSENNENKLSSLSIEIKRVSATITDITDGELEVSAKVIVDGNVNYSNSKYVFTTSNEPLGTEDVTKYKDGIIENSEYVAKATKVGGTYYLHVLLVSNTGKLTEVISNTTASCQGKKDFAYIGDVQTITLAPAKYKLEVWGAQGGGSQLNGNTSNLGVGGKGGYSYGNITLKENTILNVYVGSQGEAVNTGIAHGGYNGGGSAWGTSSSEPAAGGGGATDFRINSTSLYARVIVAGAGGGGGEDAEAGGYGGGTVGGTSGSGTPGNVTSPSGQFGQGGHTNYDGGGGGAGWYGASVNGNSLTEYTSNSTSDTSGSPGGSGYVYTESSASNYPSGCLLDISKHKLENAETKAGNTSFTSPTGTNETGHTGDGYARITVIE